MGMKNSGDVFCQATDQVINQTREELLSTLPDFRIYKSVNDFFMQARSKEDLEVLVSTFFKYCYAKKIKILLKKFQLSTNVTFEEVNIDPSADDMLVFSLHRAKLEEARNFTYPAIS